MCHIARIQLTHCALSVSLIESENRSVSYINNSNSNRSSNTCTHNHHISKLHCIQYVCGVWSANAFDTSPCDELPSGNFYCDFAFFAKRCSFFITSSYSSSLYECLSVYSAHTHRPHTPLFDNALIIVCAGKNSQLLHWIICCLLLLFNSVMLCLYAISQLRFRSVSIF